MLLVSLELTNPFHPARVFTKQVPFHPLLAGAQAEAEEEDRRSLESIS